MPPLPRPPKVRALAVVAVLGLCACRSATPEAPPYDRRALVASLGEHVILPGYRTFTARAAALAAATRAHATAVAAGDATGEREAARGAWREAMRAWQRAELMQVGPAGSPLMTTGGKSLRDEIYSWPTVSTCRVDQEVVTARYGEAGYLDGILVTASGLAALEYLLFNDSAQNTCPSTATINTSGSWAALSAQELTRRRAEYAAAAAAQLQEEALQLEAEWADSGGNFLRQLASAGESGSAFSTAQMAVDEVFAAMFYLDLRAKDRKLAVPVGLSPLCPSASCPEALESRFAEHSADNVLENLRAFRALFVGNEAGAPEREGFDDYLVARGAPDLARSILQDVDAAMALVESTGSFEAALAADPAKLEAVHAAIKKVTDAMKTQMVTVLNLRVPQEGAADND